ncbi:MAG: type VI secretion system contractile sheath large subunit [Planctomycetaceae bacterium]|nr:type VI secretion system contractile sheath large subunit [Planctomycetaceae bacterium]
MSTPQSQHQPETVAYSEHPPSTESGGAAGPASLLDRILDHGRLGKTAAIKDDFLERFLSQTSPAECLRIWFGRVPETAAQMQEARFRLARDIARIDRLLSQQVNEILHCPEFQALEASWRGLFYLWQSRDALFGEHGFDDADARIEIRVLNVSKRELQKDFERAVDFDQNSLFHKVYEEEFGTAGGTPYGLLVADYEFTNHPDDLDLLNRLSGVGAAAFAPVIAAAAPDLIGLDHFSDLEKPVDLERVFQQDRHRKWRSLRDRVDSQFLGLTLPRVLMRDPYRDDGGHAVGFRFHEDVQGADRRKYLWGSSAWAMAAVVLRAFANCGWFADIRGVERGVEGGGLVTGLPTHSFHTDGYGVARRSSAEVALSDRQEAELCDLGFIPLSHCKDTPYSVFYSNQSVHQPAQYDDPVVTANARISAMLQYVLCCSRIAHYVKVLARNKLGTHMSPYEIQNEVQTWLVQYVTPDEKADPAMKAQYPLREADVEVSEIPGQPGKYTMTVRLLPHYQLDQLSSSMELVVRRVDLKE